MTLQLLMLDADRRLIAAVTRALASDGIRVVGAESTDSARELGNHQHWDAALLDCDAFDVRELTVLATLPVILTSASLDTHAPPPFTSALTLHKPFTSTQLSLALRELRSEAPPAEPTRLLDVLRRAHDTRSTCALGIGRAELHMVEGEISHAADGDQVGEDALREILASGEPPHKICAQPAARTIWRPFQALMLDLLRSLDERERRAKHDSGIHEVTKEPIP